MLNAVIAARKPIAVTLEADKEYFWCQCGRSKNQPFCDGSHQGTGITPIKFNALEGGKKYLCMCKQTATAPYCDGTHNKLPEDVTEMAVPAR